MIVAVQGSRDFSDYQVVLRAMGVAMSSLKEEDKYIYIYSAGPSNINNMMMEFVNLSERGLKLRGKKIKLHKVAPAWIEENILQFDYFVYLCLPKEKMSVLAHKANSANIEVGIFSY
jgi:hypothetical protein